MRSHRDLVEAQAFDRRRLVAAFVTGAEEGGEVATPATSLRAVVGGLVLAAVVVVASFASGLLAPSLPDGWDRGSLVVVTDTGARYAALDGTLHPVVNSTSARLLVRSGFHVVTARSDQLTGTRHGATLGIVGAPDAVPPAPALVTTGWTACAGPDGAVTTRVSRAPDVTPVTDRAIVATVPAATGATTYLLEDGRRHEIAADLVTPLVRALRLDATPPLTTTRAFVDLFPPGSDIAPFPVPGSGTSQADRRGLPPDARTGSVLATADSPDRPYLLLDGGTVAPLTPFAAAVHRTAPGPAVDVTLSASVFAGLGRADPVWPPDWPTTLPGPVGGTPCALLRTGRGDVTPSVASAVAPGSPDTGTGTTVDAGAGALVRAVDATPSRDGPVYLVDQTGTAFPVQGTDAEDPLARLGFSADDVVPVPRSWVGLFDVGPALSVDAARTVVTAPTRR